MKEKKKLLENLKKKKLKKSKKKIIAKKKNIRKNIINKPSMKNLFGQSKVKFYQNMEVMTQDSLMTELISSQFLVKMLKHLVLEKLFTAETKFQVTVI